MPDNCLHIGKFAVDRARRIARRASRFCRLCVCATIFTLTSCALSGVPDGITPVEDFELQRYLGTWYEIARLDHRFERGLSGVTAVYSLNDNGSVKVVNSGTSSKTGKRKSATGKALFVGPASRGHLKVSFFGPFYGSYIIFELDKENYSHALVAGPSRKFLWVLARGPDMDATTYDALLAKAQSNGFDVDKLIKVKH